MLLNPAALTRRVPAVSFSEDSGSTGSTSLVATQSGGSPSLATMPASTHETDVTSPTTPGRHSAAGVSITVTTISMGPLPTSPYQPAGGIFSDGITTPGIGRSEETWIKRPGFSARPTEGLHRYGTSGQAIRRWKSWRQFSLSLASSQLAMTTCLWNRRHQRVRPILHRPGLFLEAASCPTVRNGMADCPIPRTIRRFARSSRR